MDLYDDTNGRFCQLIPVPTAAVLAIGCGPANTIRYLLRRQPQLRITDIDADIELWDRINARYAAFFGDHRPVRCVVSTGRLHYGSLVEIEALAAVEQ